MSADLSLRVIWAERACHVPAACIEAKPVRADTQASLGWLSTIAIKEAA